VILYKPPYYYVTNFVFSASRLPRLLSLDCGEARRKSAVCMKAPTNNPLGKRHGPNLKLPSGWCVGVGASLPPSPCLSTSTRHKLAGWQHHSDCPCVYPPMQKLCGGVCAWMAVFMRMSVVYVIGCVFVLFMKYGNVGSRSQRCC